MNKIQRRHVLTIDDVDGLDAATIESYATGVVYTWVSSTHIRGVEVELLASTANTLANNIIDKLFNI